MCIICNTKPEHEHVASKFLTVFASVNAQMREAEALLLEVSNHTVDAESGNRYKRVHKMMVRTRKAWNALEQERER